MKQQILAAKTAFIGFVFSLAIGTLTLPAQAGIPVVDAGNLTQNVLTAIENVSQTLTLVQQYQSQLQQYEDQLKNSLAPASFVWSKAQATMKQLDGAINTLNYYKQQAGSLDKYLARYKDLRQYQSSPCFSAGGCSDKERAALLENRQRASEAQKRANDAMFRGLEKQQASLNSDASKLSELQRSAQGAQGRLEAIQYANQFASQQTSQLMQIHALLIAQQNALATKNEAEVDRAAQQTAASKAWRAGKYVPSTGKGWKPSDVGKAFSRK